MGIKFRLTVMSFLQFFVWGAWLITIANYWFGTKQWDSTYFGLVFSTMGFASIAMPTITGIIADRWMNAEKLYGFLHVCYAVVLFCLPFVTDPVQFIYVMMLAMCFYMPTISLNNAISYSLLKRNGFDLIKSFPPIRVWGTLGFIAAMWITNITGNKASVGQFYIAGAAALVLGAYSFFLPTCPPSHKTEEHDANEKRTVWDAFSLFKNYKMALFFVFSMFLGGALQLTNAYGDVFLSEFSDFPKYADSFVAKYSTLIMSISQFSETAFILAIPFFLRKFGIKRVMLISMLAWVLRFGLFSYGNPAESLWMIILSCIVYGMAFDFFNISGSLFVETQTRPSIRSSAQGLFMMMTNGFGAVMGSFASGWIIGHFFTRKISDINALSTYLDTTPSNAKLATFLSGKGITVSPDGLFSKPIELREWPEIWFWFAVYALVIAIAFGLLFKHKHDPKEVATVAH